MACIRATGWQVLTHDMSGLAPSWSAARCFEDNHFVLSADDAGGMRVHNLKIVGVQKEPPPAGARTGLHACVLVIGSMSPASHPPAHVTAAMPWLLLVALGHLCAAWLHPIPPLKCPRLSGRLVFAHLVRYVGCVP